MLIKKYLQELEDDVDACKIKIAASGISTAEIAQETTILEVRLEAARNKLLEYEGMLRGALIAKLGTQLAAQAGKDVKPGLFEMYESAKEKDKLLVEAGLFYKLWETSSSGSELRSKLSGSPLRTFTFGLAAIRVAEHFDEVKAQFSLELDS